MTTKQSHSLAARMLALAFGLVLGAPALAQVNDLPGGPAVNQLNLHPPATQIAEQQQWLHWMMLIICLVIFVAVFGVMFYSILKHRKSVGHKASQFHENTLVEILWTVIPAIILVIIAVPVTKVVIAQKDTSAPELTIKVKYL